MADGFIQNLFKDMSGLKSSGSHEVFLYFSNGLQPGTAVKFLLILIFVCANLLLFLTHFKLARFVTGSGSVGKNSVPDVAK